MNIRLWAVLFKRHFHRFKRDRGSFWIALLFPWLTSMVLQIAMVYSGNSPMYVFFCMIFCYWFFLNLGVRQFTSEQQVLKRELYAGLSPRALLLTRFILFALVGAYMAAVFTMSINVDWLDWKTLQTAVHGKLQGLDSWQMKDLTSVDHGQQPKLAGQMREHNRQLARYLKSLKALQEPSSLFFVTRRMRNDNPWGKILVLNKSGKWQFAPYKGNTGDFFTQRHRYFGHLNLWQRIIRQIVQLALLDYGLIFLFLAASCGLSLGLCISVYAPSPESAGQVVPYVTLYQIILSSQVISRGHFQVLSSYSWSDLAGWDFGSLLSLSTASRVLQTCLTDGISSQKVHILTLGILIQDYCWELMLILIWLVIPVLIALRGIYAWTE